MSLPELSIDTNSINSNTSTTFNNHGILKKQRKNKHTHTHTKKNTSNPSRNKGKQTLKKPPSCLKRFFFSVIPSLGRQPRRLPKGRLRRLGHRVTPAEVVMQRHLQLRCGGEHEMLRCSKYRRVNKSFFSFFWGCLSNQTDIASAHIQALPKVNVDCS